ncbi:MAG TPA: hypothetical protein VJ875_01745 [Pyrinomonadaceae bacterium]|nr:hypothetical protein [Pyrinomonadaceae bacterium]
MKLSLIPLLVLMLAANSYAQATSSAAESVEKLRAQLLEVQAKEESLRVRAEQLEESLKPENIERSLAGVGSTKPEELRESRRRQLTIERDGVQAQLKILETSRQRLEAAIANAEIKAYQESARPAIEMTAVTTPSNYHWWVYGGGGGFAALALAGAVVLFRRKIRLR